MINKIIGFTISKEKIPLDIQRIFSKNITIHNFIFNNFYIFLWGIGNIQECLIDNKYSLSFPLNEKLLDRNVIIYFDKENIIIENDWLGSIPVFYNPKALIVSTISNYCLKDKKINSEGLNNYCIFGYSVFEQTPFENVKFMRYYSKLLISKNKISIKYKKDIISYKTFQKTSSEDEVIHKIKTYINDIKLKTNKELILPLSGGFDSRFLLSLFDSKENITTFTYGISENQSESFEVVYAQKLSELLKVKWHQIELHQYHNYINEWFKIYGISTHTHGMYHIEFYKEIQKNYNLTDATFLSGIIGDAWAGSINYTQIKSHDDIINLGYSHGLNLDATYLNGIYLKDSIKKFYEKNKELLQNDKFKVIVTIRLKIILLSYLCQIPEYFGIPAWSPFLNFDNVITILNLPEDLRKNRKWQIDYFDKINLNIGKMNLDSSKNNDLNYKIASKIKVEKIDINLMKGYFKITKLNQINKIIQGVSDNENFFVDKEIYIKTLSEYYTVLSIQKGLNYEY